MRKHADESADRALIASMIPRNGVKVDPSATNLVPVPDNIQPGVVPLERTLAKPQAYKPTKGAP